MADENDKKLAVDPQKAEAQKAKEDAEKKEKADLEKWNAAPAMGPHTGGAVVTGTEFGHEYLMEQYIGIGPLVVKNARGDDIKAYSGDYILSFWKDPVLPEASMEAPRDQNLEYRSGPVTGRPWLSAEDVTPVEYVFVLPGFLIDQRRDSSPKPKGMTNAEYQALLKKRAEQLDKRLTRTEAKLAPAQAGQSSAQQGPKKTVQ